MPKSAKLTSMNPHAGIHGLGEQNQRGERLLEFCAGNDLVIGNTLFPHHPRRLYTWQSPGDRARNQIDYIIVKRRWRSALSNVKTLPGADCGSDHQLLLAKVQIRLKATKKQPAAMRFDVQAIPDSFSVAIQNRFQPLLERAEENSTPEELWTELSTIVKETAKEHIPRKTRPKEAMAAARHHPNSRAKETSKSCWAK